MFDLWLEYEMEQGNSFWIREESICEKKRNTSGLYCYLYAERLNTEQVQGLPHCSLSSQVTRINRTTFLRLAEVRARAASVDLSGYIYNITIICGNSHIL